jgi:hypothetical protein
VNGKASFGQVTPAFQSVIGDVWSATQSFPMGLNAQDKSLSSWSVLQTAPGGISLGDYWYGAFYAAPASKGTYELRFTGLWTQTDFFQPPGAPGFIMNAIHMNTARLSP